MSANFVNISAKQAAYLGLLLPVSLFVINFVISIMSAWLGRFTSLMFVFSLPVGIYVTARPVIQKENNGKREWHVLNMTVTLILSIIFVAILTAFAKEVYRCDILKVPNCD